MKINTQAVIDIETGGFSKSKNAIIEIAFVITDIKNNVLDSFETIVKRYDQENGESMIYNSKAEEVHKISEEDQINKGKDPKEVCEKIEEFFKQYNVTYLVAHNARFDIDRLKIFFERFKSDHKIEFEDFFCTMKLAKERIHLDSYSLKSLCEFYEIKNKNEHRALSDVIATNKVLKNLMNCTSQVF